MKRFITKSKILFNTIALAVIVFGVAMVMPADAQAVEPHSHDGYTAYDGTSSTPAEGSYYLADDINLTGTWNVTGTLNLCLNGHKIDAEGRDFSVITIAEGATLNLYDCAGGGSITGGKGGVTNNVGTFNMYGGTISSNTASRGGGVFNLNGATFNMSGGEITGNTATSNGGGVAFYGDGCAFNMSGSSIISRNHANNAYGGVFLSEAKFSMSGGSIDHNTADVIIGGIGGANTFYMTGGSIEYNQAKQYGGVMMNGSSSSFTMTGGSITNNTATEALGGLYAYPTEITLGGTAQISGNKAGGKANNLVLRADKMSEHPISLSSPSGMNVGVVWYSAPTDDPVAFTDTSAVEDYLDYFTSDSNAYEVKFDTNQLFLAKRTSPLPPDPDPEPQPEQPKAPEEEPELQLAEENYVPNIVQNDKTQFGKENKGSVPSGAYNFSAYVSPSGFAKGVEKIADKKDVSGNITVYSGKPLTINRELLNTLTAKKVSMTYFFNYKGHLYSVTIPSGVNPALVLDANGHGGPLYVGWLLGTSRLIK